MKNKLQNKNFSLKQLTPLVLIVCYWFYLNICLGYFLSKIFYDFFWKLIKNWETFLVFSSLMSEILFLDNLLNWAIQWIYTVYT